MNTDRTASRSVRLVSNARPQLVPSTPMDTAYQQISRGTASPVLVTDERWRIVAINPEAEKLLGCSAQEAQGQLCHAVLCGRDRYGNNFCHEQCVVGTMAQRGEAVLPFELDVTSADGELVRAACSVIVLRDGPASRIVHILTPLPSATERTSARSGAAAPVASAGPAVSDALQRYALTPRELEVLRLLAKGSDCHDIAKALFISLPTVRNHVHNFLRKMDVHSQVEAVALAYREALI
jgi:DNA-binding CsgD family transcriptional regulator